MPARRQRAAQPYLRSMPGTDCGGFDASSGEVWGLHVAWSGNHRTLAELLPSGERLLAGGELLLPGEIRLGPGDEYSGPWLHGSYGVGLDDLSDRIHRYLRDRPRHPRTPRPVTLNTWEAVYFDHDPARLSDLAEAAAEIRPRLPFRMRKLNRFS